MTKAELIAKLSALPDDAQVMINSWPEDTDDRGPNQGDVFSIASVNVYEHDGEEGDEAPPFAIIGADVKFIAE